MNNFYILIFMIFCHIIAEVLGNIEDYPDTMYLKDYLMALFIHSFSWSLMILVPYIFFSVVNISLYILLLMVNLCIHFIIDDFKANKHKLNLVQDQLIHLLQIVITWIILINI